MIGILRLKTRYRFVTNKQQLTKLFDDIQERKVQHTTVLVDATLQANPSMSTAKLISYLTVQHRHLDISIIFIGEEDTRMDKRICRLETDKLSLLAKPIKY